MRRKLLFEYLCYNWYYKILIGNTNIILIIFYNIITILNVSKLKYKYYNCYFVYLCIYTSVLLLFDVFVYIIIYWCYYNIVSYSTDPRPSRSHQLLMSLSSFSSESPELQMCTKSYDVFFWNLNSQPF